MDIICLAHLPRKCIVFKNLWTSKNGTKILKVLPIWVHLLRYSQSHFSLNGKITSLARKVHCAKNYEEESKMNNSTEGDNLSMWIHLCIYKCSLNTTSPPSLNGKTLEA